MTEKYVIRFSPLFVQAPITSLSQSAFDRFGEKISFKALGLSEELIKELTILSGRIVEIPVLKKSGALTREKQTEIYGLALKARDKLTAELDDSFEVISIMERLDPDHPEKLAKCRVRRFKDEEYPLLNDFLYDAIYIPDGAELPPRDIINSPELKVYTLHFGKLKGDVAFAAEFDGKVVGAAWARIMNDYGHIDDETPSLAIAVKKEYRGMRIGLQLMIQLLTALCGMGYKRVSLSVQKENFYAVKLYVKLGFRILRTEEQEYIMTFDLSRLMDK